MGVQIGRETETEPAHLFSGLTPPSLLSAASLPLASSSELVNAFALPLIEGIPRGEIPPNRKAACNDFAKHTNARRTQQKETSIAYDAPLVPIHEVQTQPRAHVSRSRALHKKKLETDSQVDR